MHSLDNVTSVATPFASTIAACVLWLNFFAFTFGIQVDEPVRQQASADIRWHGGELLTGNIVSMSDRVLRIQSRAFAETIELERSVLESIRFAWPSQSVAKTQAAYELVLKGGSTLRTNIQRIHDQSIWIDDPRFGQVKIPIDACLMLRSLGGVEYEWAGNIADWRQVESERAKPSGGWQVDAQGSLTTIAENDKLWLPLSLSESFVLSIRFSGKTKSEFMISTGIDPESSLRLGTIGDHMIIGTADDFEIAGVVQRGQFSLQFIWNSETKELSLRDSAGMLIAKTTEKKNCDKSGLLLHNQGQQLTIDSLRVTRGLDSADSNFDASLSEPFVALSNGEVVEIKSVELNDGRWLYESKESKSFTSNAKLKLLQFKPKEIVNAKIADVQSDRIRWGDGSTLCCRSMSMDNGRLRIVIHDSLPALVCGLESIDRVRFGIPSTGRTSRSMLTVGNNRVPGELRFGDAKYPLRWQCLGQEKPVPLSTAIPLEVALGSVNTPKVDEGFKDILYLANGDVVPCSIESMTANTTTVTTPLGAQTTIPNSDLRCVELNASGTKLRHLFTKESREMMLTIPRSAEPSLTTHVLLGVNGDLLRGNVISLSDAEIEVDSKQEPMVVQRERVAAIAFLAHENPLEDVAENEKKEGIEIDEDTPELGIMLRGGYRLTARFVSQEGGHIHGESRSLGKGLVPIEQIGAIAMRKPSFGSDLSPYSIWSTHLATAPRWSESSKAESAPDSMLGKKAPEFELSALDGSTVKLSEYAGRVVVLDFWATWCGPCVASLPEYLEVMGEFPETDAVFFGVNSTETPEVVRSFKERKGLTGFNSLFDYDQSLMNSMGGGGIPHTVVIGPGGEVAYVHVGYKVGAAKEVAQAVRQLLKK